MHQAGFEDHVEILGDVKAPCFCMKSRICCASDE